MLQRRFYIIFVVFFWACLVQAKPIADAGLSRYAAIDPITLDGSHSYDPEGNGGLSYQWTQIAGPELSITGADTANPVVSGFIQTNNIQECILELVVSNADLESEPDTVSVFIVPDFEGERLELINPPFDPDKPTIVAFGGGNCRDGNDLRFGGKWIENANWITSRDTSPLEWYTYSPPYERYADWLIVYLSKVAPDYKQPIQAMGPSTAGMPVSDVSNRLNSVYADPRYNVNRMTFLDVGCRDHIEDIETFLNHPVDGEQCWIDNYFAMGVYYPDVLNIIFPGATHNTPRDWMKISVYESTVCPFSLFGFQDDTCIKAGYYYSVAGPGKNLQLAEDTSNYFYRHNKPHGELSIYSIDYPGILPGAVTLIGPDSGTLIAPNGVILTSENSANAVGYQLLFGSDQHRVQDYYIVSDTPTPPNETITGLPFKETWWTVRAYDQYGSTIYADPRLLIAPNTAPIADAGSDKTGVVSKELSLDGSASHDPDGDTLIYGWNFITVPTGSVADLSDANAVNPSFVPDLPGGYVISLVVNDGLEDSEADSVTVTALSLQEAVVLSLDQAIEVCSNPDPNSLVSNNMSIALTNKIEAVLNMVEHGNYKGAFEKLKNDILSKMDGCVNEGKPDKNDWIIICDEQEKGYSLITETITYLSNLIGT